MQSQPFWCGRGIDLLFSVLPVLSTRATYQIFNGEKIPLLSDNHHKRQREKDRTAVFWGKVILVIFVIFKLGPDSESLCNALPSESISCGITPGKRETLRKSSLTQFTITIENSNTSKYSTAVAKKEREGKENNACL